MKFEELASNEQIRKEYQKTLLLNIFQKFCIRMNNNADFALRIRKLYREASDKTAPIIGIINREFKYSLSTEEAALITKWFEAYLNKKKTRNKIPQSVKDSLIQKQKGMCAICGEPLGNVMAKIHVDHIIPWKLVGDELNDNYQALCETCNECKSARTDYIFKALLNLN